MKRFFFTLFLKVTLLKVLIFTFILCVQNFGAPSFDDKKLEVVAVFGSMQMAMSRVINLQHHRIAQVTHTHTFLHIGYIWTLHSYSLKRFYVIYVNEGMRRHCIILQALISPVQSYHTAKQTCIQ